MDGMGNMPANVPIVGETPVDIIACAPVVAMRCQCHPANTITLLSGLDTRVRCARCRRAYFIEKIRFDREQGEFVIGLGHERPALIDADTAVKH